MTNKAKFIVVEGVDGAGKDVVIEYIRTYMLSRGIDYVDYREPGGSDIGEQVRQHICHTPDLSHAEQATLLMADRLLGYKHYVVPAIEQGFHVLASRYFYSTLAYQHEASDLTNHLADVLDLDKADCIIYVRCSVESLRDRVASKNVDSKESYLLEGNALQEYSDRYDRIMDGVAKPLYLFDSDQPLEKYPALIAELLDEIL